MILELCTNKRVLHLGCVDYPLLDFRIRSRTWLHGKLMETAKEVIGIDSAKEEIERFMRGEKGDSLKKKVDRWFMRDMFEEFYRPLIVEAEQLNDTTLRVSLLEEKREDVFDRAMMSDSSEKGVDDVDQALHLIAEVLGRGDVRILHPAAQNAWDTIEKKLNRMSSADGQYVYSVQMPGLILDTNSDAVEGTTASWKFEAEQFHVGDIVMHASSRVTNVWAFVVTALVVLIAGIIAVPVILRRRS